MLELQDIAILHTLSPWCNTIPMLNNLNFKAQKLCAAHEERLTTDGDEQADGHEDSYIHVYFIFLEVSGVVL